MTANTWFLLLDARFEVLGTPYSLLSVSLAASQKLYTRRGTLVSVSGKAQNVRTAHHLPRLAILYSSCLLAAFT